MPSFNKAIMMGNLTRDPELREVGNSVVCKFAIAMNEIWTDKVTGEKKENTTFVDVEAWERTGEVIDEYFSKGKPIMFEGKLKLDQWEDKESGQNRSRHYLLLERFSFVDSANGDGNSNGKSSSDEEDTDDDNTPF